jgi:hypothetical protein
MLAIEHRAEKFEQAEDLPKLKYFQNQKMIFEPS